MKKIYFLIILLYLGAGLELFAQTTKISKTIEPLFPTTTPVVKHDYVQGGYHHVTTTTERDALIKQVGMLVYVSGTKATYRWDGTAWKVETSVRNWATGSAYAAGDVFVHNDLPYIAKVPGTILTGETPATNVGYWTNVMGGSSLQGTSVTRSSSTFNVLSTMIDAYSGVAINQSVINSTLTLEPPISNPIGKTFTVQNTSSGGFNLTYGKTVITPGTSALFVYNGTAWSTPSSAIELNNGNSLFSSSIGAGATAAGASTSITGLNAIILGVQAGVGVTTSNGANMIGYYAGNGALTSQYANFIGYQAGKSTGTPTLTNSNFIGYQAGSGNIAATSSNFIGYQAGYTATNAAMSNFIGYKAGLAASEANNSNFIGFMAGNAASAAIYSNFFGSKAGMGATNALHSNFIGFKAGANAASASFSTIIGYRSGTPGIGNNNIIIGSRVSLTDAFTNRMNIGGVLFGSGFKSDTTTVSTTAIAGGKIGIGVVDPAAVLHLAAGTTTYAPLKLTSSGSLKLVTPQAGAIEFYDGHLYFTTANGATPSQLDGQSMAMGSVGSSPNASGGTITGGSLSLEFANAANPGIVSAGMQTFAGNKSFKDKVLIGGVTAPGALLELAVGTDALAPLKLNSSGTTKLTTPQAGAIEFYDGHLYFTTANGATPSQLDGQSMAMGSVGSTPNASGGTITGGSLSLELANNTYPGIVSTGAQTFKGTKTFSDGIAVSNGRINSGTSIGYLFDTGVGTLYIGHDATSVTIGNSATSSISNIVSNLMVGNPAGTNIVMNGADLKVAGDGEFDGNLWVDGTLATPSDARLKTKIETLTGVLAKLNQMRGVSYEFKDQEKYAKGPQVGVIAQELLKVFPELVSQGDGGFYAVNYSQLTGVLIQAVKEQQLEIDQLKLQMQKVMKKLGME